MNRILFACAVPIVTLALGFATGTPKRAQNRDLAAQQSPAPVRFAFGGNAAEIPAQFLDNLVLLPVRVNNSQPSFFLLDSTAAASSIAPGRAAELGPGALSHPVLSLPGVEFSVATLPAIADDHFAAQTGRTYQGTLGKDFLGSVVAEIDYGRKTVRLYDPSIYKYAGGGTSLPLTFSGGLPMVRASLTLPKQHSREGEYIVDTALNGAIVISDKFAEGHHLFSARLKTITACDPQIDGGENIVLGRPNGFEIGPYTVEGAIAAFSPRRPAGAANSDVAGTIGGGILRRFIVAFDYAHQQMILAPNLHLHDLEEEDKSGLAIIATGPGLKRFDVVAVQPGTPGARAGIQKGDIIAGMDEEAAADLTLADIRELFREASRTRNLVIERNGQSLRISIQLRRLL